MAQDLSPLGGLCGTAVNLHPQCPSEGLQGRGGAGGAGEKPWRRGVVSPGPGMRRCHFLEVIDDKRCIWAVL